MTKILVVEDEAILRGEVVEWLTLEDYEAVGAADGIEGIKLANNHLPDLIVCDITMPRLDGHGVLLELRSNPATVDIPFIFVTARAAHEDIRKGMDLGADDYITKPFTRKELLRAIQSRLDKKATQEQNVQREIEQWEQALAHEREQRLFKAKLVAMVSHDFRNPLASILISNSLLRDYADRMDEQRRLLHLNRIEGSVRQLIQMLDDMLIVAQMETDNLNFRPESLNLGELLQQIVDEFKPILGEHHGIVFENQFNDTVLADPRLLRQISANLISNAVKYSPEGGEVWVSLTECENHWVLKVQDHGIGIPEADQIRLFQAFRRGSNVGELTGTGLGLAIVKQAVDLHNGSVSVESQVGKGTTMIVTVPITR